MHGFASPGYVGMRFLVMIYVASNAVSDNRLILVAEIPFEHNASTTITRHTVQLYRPCFLPVGLPQATASTSSPFHSLSINKSKKVATQTVQPYRPCSLPCPLFSSPVENNCKRPHALRPLSMSHGLANPSLVIHGQSIGPVHALSTPRPCMP